MEVVAQSVILASAMERPSWNEYFMRIAREVSTRSTCLRRKVGAVLVRDKRILATGYNGAPRGLPHCADVGCLREARNVPPGERHELCRGMHAEMNAIVQAACHGISIQDSNLYSTVHPCILCAKMLINAGIRRVMAAQDYPDDMSKQMLAQAGVELIMETPSRAASADPKGEA